MASYLPPTEELPIFDNQVFDTLNNTALTYAEAKKYFVSYPIAQGTATITDLITGEISYQSPASGSIFEIGTNQVSGGTIKIGPTGGTAGVSVHCANLDFKNNAMNNATSNTVGDISIGSLQTSGELNIGTGARVTSGNGGAINIGNNASSAAPINIGGVNTTSTFNGLINTNTNKRYSTTTTSADITEYLSGGITQISHNQTGDFNLGTTRLNKTLNVIITGGNVQTFTFPSSPQLGQIINLRSTKTGGSITLYAVGSILFYSSNVAGTALVNGKSSIVLPNLSTSSWLYYELNKWMQMNDSLYPLVDTDAGTTGLSIGSTLVNGNIVIGAALGVGDISIASAQLAGGTVTIGSSNTVSTISGTLTSGRGVLSGNTICPVYDSFAGNQTISTTLNVDAFIVIYGGLGSSIFTIPTGFPTGQRLTFKSTATNVQTLRFTNKIVILSNGTQTGVSDFTFANAAVLNVIFNGTLWYQT